MIRVYGLDWIRDSIGQNDGYVGYVKKDGAWLEVQVPSSIQLKNEAQKWIINNIF